jgi:hypothetical protein
MSSRPVKLVKQSTRHGLLKTSVKQVLMQAVEHFSAWLWHCTVQLFLTQASQSAVELVR